jgi:predicted RNA-binding protein associated with RNAse of E/G family
LPRPVTIVYRRLPNDVREFPGLLRYESDTRLVIQTQLTLPSPHRVAGRVIADTGFSAIWFIYRDRWYDLGKLYDRAGVHVGYYSDILKPPHRLLLNSTRTTKLTDLFLDLWITPRGEYYVLDEDEIQNALNNGHISSTLASVARKHLASLIRQVERGRFPPIHVREIELLNSGQ